MKSTFDLHRWVKAGPAGFLTALLASCTSTPLPPMASAPAPVASLGGPPAVQVAAADHTTQTQAEHRAAPAVSPPDTPISNIRTSGAVTPRAYRSDAATHLYGLHRDRIYKGRMPPLLYAVGVLQVDVDGQGKVRSLSWMRKPSHAPEVVAEIERMVRAAAPYPAPVRMGHVTYTDTWLWHKSGRFQLDTLTEGQD